MNLTQFFRDFFDLERAVKAIEEIAPPTIKLRISKTMLPWMEVWFCVMNSGADIEFVKKALYQAGCYNDPATIDGKPKEAIP